MHSYALSSGEVTEGSTYWSSQEGVGEGWDWGEVARKCVGEEACSKGAETGSHRFWAVQGHEIAEACTVWGPKITGKSQGCCEIRIDGMGVWSWLHRVAGFLCFYGSSVCYVKRLQASNAYDPQNHMERAVRDHPSCVVNIDMMERNKPVNL